MLHLPPAHHKTSKRDSPNQTKIKEKQNEIVPDSNSNLAKSMTHHNQTKELSTWFLIALVGEILVAGSVAVAAAHFAGSSVAVFAATKHLTSASNIVAVASKIGGAVFASASVVGSSMVA
jgi:hypothetical protein